MEIDKRKHKDSLNRIRQVLLDSWDPMGVQDSPDSFDEYDTYAMQILSLILKGAKEPQVMAYLSEVETDLGLDEPAEDDLLPVAKKLLAIRIAP